MTEKIHGLTDDEIKSIVEISVGRGFSEFQDNYPIEKTYYRLDASRLVMAVDSASVGLNRVGSWHSDTGANVFKKAAYIGKWIAEDKPIQVLNYPVNLNTATHLNLLRINACFSVYVIGIILGDLNIYTKLALDLRYCFEYRHRIDEDSIAMLLEHALEHAPKIARTNSVI